MSKWVAPSSKGRWMGTYHTDKDCSKLKREPRQISDRDAEALELRLCKVCDPEYTNQHDATGEVDYYEAAKNA